MISADDRIDHPIWTDDACRRHGAEPVVVDHHLHRWAAFDDEGLIDLLDRTPRRDVSVFAMDVDPDDPDRWVPVDAAKTTGADLMTAIERGRLFVHLAGIDRVHEATRRFVADDYDQLAARVEGLDRERVPSASLTISSPGVVQRYRFDPFDTMLWQVRGTRHVWFYPAAMRHLVPLELQEAIFAEAADGELPYEPTYDVHALHLELGPGALASWPHGAPHRSVNGPEVSVSLVTTVGSVASTRRRATYLANRYLRRHTPVGRLSTRTSGWRPAIKRLAHRVASRVYDRGRDASPSRWTHYVIDPASPDGLAYSDRPLRAHFDRSPDRRAVSGLFTRIAKASL